MTAWRRLSGPVFLAAALGTSGAAASSRFPAVIQASLGLDAEPPCTLCHQTDRGGENTTTQPFGRTMQEFGAVKKNDSALIRALQQVDAEGIDSDGDCIPDIDELVEKPPGDPNVRSKKGDAGVCAVPQRPPILKTGCTVSSHGRTEFVTALSCACVVVLVCRRAGAKIVRRRFTGRRRA